jgi:hypothetical protein
MLSTICSGGLFLSCMWVAIKSWRTIRLGDIDHSNEGVVEQMAATLTFAIAICIMIGCAVIWWPRLFA